METKKGKVMIKLILLMLVIQYVVVYVKYKQDKYQYPEDFKNEMFPGYLWYKVIKQMFS